MSNQIDGKIVLGLDTKKSAAQINSDLKKLQNQLSQVKITGVLDSSLNNANKKIKSTVNSLQELGTAFKGQMSQAAQSITKWLSLNTVVTRFISQTRNAIKELKQVDTLLTRIGTANERLSRSDLSRIGNDAFTMAGKYGKSAADYLSAVQDALRAGYKNAEAIAELSLAAQSAGDMTADLASQMIAAADKAYGMNGSVSELTRALDGMSGIAGRHGIAMTELSDGMASAASTAASLGVGLDEMTAALGAMIDTTHQSGSETADAFRSILLSIGQITDESAGIDAEGLANYEAACSALNVKLKETKNGIISLRDPMTVLEELAAAYNSLDKNDSRRTALLDSVGSASVAAQLDALLRGWDTYESMLQQYANGTGSIAEKAEQTADSWEGSMNRLSNTWTATLGNITDSDAIVTIVNGLNSLLSVVNHVTDGLGSLGTIGLGAGLFAGIKNAGRVKRNPFLSNMPVTV